MQKNRDEAMNPNEWWNNFSILNIIEIKYKEKHKWKILKK